jgi:hypothetical protein
LDNRANNPKSGKTRVGYLGREEVGTWISRADIADFMLKQIQDTKYLRRASAISIIYLSQRALIEPG